MLILLVAMVLFWGILNSDFGIENLIWGLLLSGLVLYVSRGFIADSDLPSLRMSQLGVLGIYVIKSFIRIVPSSLTVIRAVLKQESRVDRVVIDLPTDLRFVNALVCNSITLTPGTVTLEFFDRVAEVLVINPDHKSPDVLKKDIEAGFHRLRQL